MHVLVTGGAGYVGSHTAKALHSAGITPVVFDNLSRGHRWAVQWGPLVEADLNDVKILRRTIEHYSIEAVIHFAAFAYVGESTAHPGIYFRNNVGNTLNLLETMRDTGVSRLIFSSTCATYGTPETPTLSESHLQSPVNPYGESKRTAERMLHWFGEAHGLQSVILRYFNAAGADSDGATGECHFPEPHLIPVAISAALGLREPLQIYGSDYPTPDGTAVRDYVHVADLAQAHLRALYYLQNSSRSATFNLGTSQGHSVLDVLSSIQRLTGTAVPYRLLPRRIGDPPSLVANVAKAASALSWTPTHSSLDNIVGTAWTWHQSRVLEYAR